MMINKQTTCFTSELMGDSIMENEANIMHTMNGNRRAGQMGEQSSTDDEDDE